MKALGSSSTIACSAYTAPSSAGALAVACAPAAIVERQRKVCCCIRHNMWCLSIVGQQSLQGRQSTQQGCACVPAFRLDKRMNVECAKKKTCENDREQCFRTGTTMHTSTWQRQQGRTPERPDFSCRRSSVISLASA